MSEHDETKAAVSSRRALLKFGAIAAPAVATLNPGSAFAAVGAASILDCIVHMPAVVDANGTPLHLPPGQIKWDSNGVEGWTKGKDPIRVFKAGIPYTGEELKQAGVTFASPGFHNRPIKAQTDAQFMAHVQYLDQTRAQGGVGASCLMSVYNAASAKQV